MKARLVVIAALTVALVGALFVSVPYSVRAQDPTLPNGPWLDRLVWSEQPDAALALEQIRAGEADFFMFSLQGAQQKEDALQSSEVLTFSTFGSVNGLLFNPNVQADGEPMNPFTDMEIREAMNWLIDRDFIVQEIMDGFAVQHVVPWLTMGSDYARELDTMQSLEADYQADQTLAEQVVNDRMSALGATINADGVWQDANGRVIDLVIINRIEDERFEIGQYVGQQLESVGFQVTMDPSPSSDAIPLVYGGDPTIGNWHVYTEGWAFTANVNWYDAFLWIFHDCIFEPFCEDINPGVGTYDTPDEFSNAVTRLAFGLYQSLDERQQIIRDYTPWALNNTNYRMWLMDEQAIFPTSSRVESTIMDAFGGPWTQFTLKSAKLVPGEPGVNLDTGVGGTAQVLNFIAFNDAWNPWTDPGWLYDAIQRRAIGDPGVWLHPDTGQVIDYRVSTVAETAGPTSTMAVPETALHWNVTRSSYPDGEILSQGFVEVGSGVTAVSKVTTTLEKPGKWHTGADITMDDVIYSLAAAFRRSFGNVSDHDAQAASAGTKFFLANTLKGVEFNLQDRTVTAYINFWHPDEAEIRGAGALYMFAGDAPVPWEIQEALLQTIIDDKAAIHETTSQAKDVPWLDLGRNPDSIAAIDEAFAAIRAENRIPEGMDDIPGLGQIIGETEAELRYDGALAFREDFGHWYASNGPFVLEDIDPLFKQTVMTAFRDGYPYKPDHWNALKVIRVPQASFGTFPSSILPGEEATLTVTTTEGGQPADPQAVRWFIRELATDDIRARGTAVRTGTGAFEVQIQPTETGRLQTGTHQLVVVVQGVTGSITSSFTFTVTPLLTFFQAIFDEIENRLDTQGQDLTDLTQNVNNVQSTASGLQTLVTAVLALAVIAIVVPTVMLVVILRRLPPPGGG